MLLWAVKVPPLRSAYCRETAKPRPIPFGFVVNKGSKTRSRFSRSMPGPLSAISTVNMFPRTDVRISMRPFAPAACAAFRRRLIRIRSICSASTRTRELSSSTFRISMIVEAMPADRMAVSIILSILVWLGSLCGSRVKSRSSLTIRSALVTASLISSMHSIPSLPSLSSHHFEKVGIVADHTKWCADLMSHATS